MTAPQRAAARSTVLISLSLVMVVFEHTTELGFFGSLWRLTTGFCWRSGCSGSSARWCVQAVSARLVAPPTHADTQEECGEDLERKELLLLRLQCFLDAQGAP